MIVIIIVMISTMLSSNSRWAYPVTSYFDASLEDHINHVLPTDILFLNLNASCLPSFIHLVLTFPLTCKHDTIVRLLIKIMDILHAEFYTLMLSAHPPKLAIVMALKFGLYYTTIC